VCRKEKLEDCWKVERGEKLSHQENNSHGWASQGLQGHRKGVRIIKKEKEGERVYESERERQRPRVRE
jgi:hypothetical protein